MIVIKLFIKNIKGSFTYLPMNQKSYYLWSYNDPEVSYLPEMREYT
jgi:hypothetical protein